MSRRGLVSELHKKRTRPDLSALLRIFNKKSDEVKEGGEGGREESISRACLVPGSVYQVVTPPCVWDCVEFLGSCTSRPDKFLALV